MARLTDRRGVLRAAGVVVGCRRPGGLQQPAGAGGAVSGVLQLRRRDDVGDHASATATASETSATTTAAAGGTPVSEIPVGSGKIFADTKTVVTQPTAGTFKAFDAVCPHEGCTVASFEGSEIVCPCHQSHFDSTTGDRVSGPARPGSRPRRSPSPETPSRSAEHEHIQVCRPVGDATPPDGSPGLAPQPAGRHTPAVPLTPDARLRPTGRKSQPASPEERRRTSR